MLHTKHFTRDTHSISTTMADFKDELVDVKFDLKDTHSGDPLNSLSDWTKCYVRIEAIECFPCYLKVSIYHATDVNRDEAFSVLRLNIPGVEVGSVAFRKKSFAYGLCWKNNRKRCRLFMAFAEKRICKMHMEHVEKSIESLEKYRKDTIQNCRLSKQIADGNVPFEAANIDFDDELANELSSYHQLSMRRASGCSGIYEEISVSPDSVKRNQEPRGSIVSAIYVDMSNSPSRTEVPPPLPPRRPPHIYTAMSAPASNGALKHQRSSWNLKSVFGRGKTDKAPKVAVPKCHTSDLIGARLGDEFQSFPLANCRSSFSTPDLTIAIAPPKSASIDCKKAVDEVDGGDLDVMDIERSNSLNTSTNQFSRPIPINVSANIQWSHNLSTTMSSSTCNSSAINLVGANVNSIDSISGFDLSGYCRMIPIRGKEESPMDQTSTKPINADAPKSPNHFLLNNTSVYCTMAALPTKGAPKTEEKMESIKSATTKSQHSKEKHAELTKNITFARHFDFDQQIPPLELSFQNEIAETKSAYNESISSDEGIASSISNNTTKTTSIDSASICSIATYNNDHIEHLSPDITKPQLTDASPNNTSPAKCDEKTPSYFPNASPLAATASAESNTKYTVNRKPSRIITKLRRKKSSCTSHGSSGGAAAAGDNGDHSKKSQTNIDATLHTPCKKSITTSNGSCKAHITQHKPRRNSSDNIENHTSCCSNDNCYGIYNRRDSRTLTPLHTLNNANNNLAVADVVKYDSQRPLLRYNHKYNLEKSQKFNKLASPRRIYNKCATFATRLRTSPPSSPSLIVTDSEMDSEYGFSRASEYSLHNRSFDSSMSAVSKADTEYHMSTSAETASGALLRSFARFRRIDFSPLKTKINNILQRTNADV